MILGESPDDESLRHVHEETLISEWLGTLDSNVVAKHGIQLGAIAREGVRAHHDISRANTLILATMMLSGRSKRTGSEDSHLPDFMDRFPQALRAKRVFYGMEAPGEPTGYKNIDTLLGLEEELLTNAEGLDDGLEALQLLEDARETARFIYHRTTPGVLAA